MIEFKQGNLLNEKTEAIVNTVNCVGVMGKGIALQFKQAYPENFKAYKRACDANEVQPGQMFVFDTGSLLPPRYVINFPTKRHWRGKSRLEDIKAGLDALVQNVQELGIQSIAIPPLGCGNGGLDWAVVKPLIVDAFAALPAIQVVIYEPGTAPAADRVKVNTTRPKMTQARALVISLFDRYGIPGYRLGRLEAQKLAYFLQEAGEATLKLDYRRHHYGPYADKLNHALQRIDGHYIRGYGDRSQSSQIYVLPEGREAATAFLAPHPDSQTRLERVSQLIEGFETPYGMEMLATLHWVAQENPKAAEDVDVAIAAVQAWSDRKRRLFKPQHLRKAWERLRDYGWMAATVG
ncbi:type II toxin-antitoxin system antitoxin DNA ADP-ribosyl glycohydrolase DarG [Leptolyngbya iicbica]|uniref:Appr-1-p processing protein n=2 Tax=Cyanophyceae TaxID=3028117 RepID=A0A4Q7EA68_9CYAN|nr:macro domain-containing protein [Leptolyngbya sp. LK]RZM79542.1 Appr-1-p processing protein [Leptolyngbya sp. LK]